MGLLEVRGLTRSFYGVQALSGVDLDVQPGTITALIGPNGAGKTTLFGCVSGVVPPDGGQVLLDGKDITGWRADRVTRAGLTRTFQVARGIPRLSVIENLLLYAPGLPGERLLAPLSDGNMLRRGDILRIETGGGGGYGHPHDRPAEAVAEDVAGGFVSVMAARTLYGVALQNGRVDADGTARLRATRPHAARFHRTEYADAAE